MSNISQLNQVHVPSALKRDQQTTNDMIVMKKNIQITAISGSNFKQGDVMESQIQSSNPFLVKNVRVVGDLSFDGTYTGAPKLQMGIHSTVKNFEVSYNTQQLVNLSRNADLVAEVNKRSNYTQEEKSWRDVQELENVEIKKTGVGKNSFVMNLDVYGLDVGYLMPTGTGNKCTIRLTFNDLMNAVFYGPLDTVGDPAVARVLTGFTLTNCYLICDQYVLTAAADGIIKNALTTPAGAEYPFLSYDVHNQKMQQAVNQNYLVPQSYRNVVSNWYIPYPDLARVANASGITTSRTLDLLKFDGIVAGANVPEKVVIEFSGGDPVNINSSVGQTGLVQHLQSLINVSKKDLNDRVSGYGWSSLYVDKIRNSAGALVDNPSRGTGIFAANFLKSDEKYAYIVNSGVNGWLSNGQCDVRFNLPTAAVAGDFITIIQFTRILKVSSNGTSRMQ